MITHKHTHARTKQHIYACIDAAYKSTQHHVTHLRVIQVNVEQYGGERVVGGSCVGVRALHQLLFQCHLCNASITSHAHAHTNVRSHTLMRNTPVYLTVERVEEIETSAKLAQ
jgi:hypothetical protein